MSNAGPTSFERTVSFPAQNTSEDTHGKNSIEAAADTTMDALHAVKDNLEKGELSGSNGK